MLTSSNNLRDPYLKLTFKKDLIIDIITKINSVPNTISYLINSEGLVICSSNESNNNIEYLKLLLGCSVAIHSGPKVCALFYVEEY